MNGLALTSESCELLKSKVSDHCGWMAGLAASEVFDDAIFHGKNQICNIMDEKDHIVVVLDCECPDQADEAEPENRRDSIIGELCQQGVVLYYYHSIQHRHHHVCLALRKK